MGIARVELRRVIPYLLGGLDIKPVLLHGDLWVSLSSKYSQLHRSLTLSSRAETLVLTARRASP
jgi:hypothetical protein